MLLNKLVKVFFTKGQYFSPQVSASQAGPLSRAHSRMARRSMLGRKQWKRRNSEKHCSAASDGPLFKARHSGIQAPFASMYWLCDCCSYTELR